MRYERMFFDEKNSDLIAYSLYQTGASNRPERERMKKILSRAITHELTARQRECMRMYYLEGKKMHEVAGELGISKSTVSRHIRSATLKLRRIAFYYQR